MPLVLEEDGVVARRTISKLIRVYPGEVITLGLNVHGPRGHVVEIIIEEQSSIAKITVSPNRAKAPYFAKMVVEVLPSAEPGRYEIRIILRDETTGVVVGVYRIVLLVLKKDTPTSIEEHTVYAKELFIKYGSNGLVWYVLKHVYPHGATFKQLKHFYELAAGKKIRDGTLCNVLRRMRIKGIITRIRSEKRTLYKLLVEDFNIVKTRIDTSRIRVHREASREKQEESRQVPYSVRLIFNRALKIYRDYGVLPAVIFLAHTLLGVRQTGFLLYWRKEDAMFIKCEKKTGFCHYFYSPLIANYFALLGVHPGVLYSQTLNYQEAHRIAGKLVNKYYKTYPYARRLHYLLKEKGLVFYEDDEENGEHVLVLEIHYYSNGEVGLRVKDNKGEEVLFEENIKPEPPLRIEIRTAFHREHIYEPNEETYFHRTNIL